MDKHAYLIICHNNYGQLKKMLELLDNPLNDIFIHVDRKSKFSKEDQCAIRLLHSKVVWVKRHSVAWGGYSQIKAEMQLLKEATNTYHAYYHLLSGADLPLKPQREIHDFFQTHMGEEFISVEESSSSGFDAFYRVGQYHFFQDIIGRKTDFFSRILHRLESVLLAAQTKLKINRLRKSYTIYKGSQWFSITHRMAIYLLTKEEEIKSLFRFGLGVDELFLQTIAMAGPFASRIVKDRIRLIDWNRGRPYVWRENDLNELLTSDALFARKFDCNVCCEIIDKIYHYLINREDPLYR